MPASTTLNERTHMKRLNENCIEHRTLIIPKPNLHAYVCILKNLYALYINFTFTHCIKTYSTWEMYNIRGIVLRQKAERQVRYKIIFNFKCLFINKKVNWNLSFEINIYLYINMDECECRHSINVCTCSSIKISYLKKYRIQSIQPYGLFFMSS